MTIYLTTLKLLLLPRDSKSSLLTALSCPNFIPIHLTFPHVHTPLTAPRFKRLVWSLRAAADDDRLNESTGETRLIRTIRAFRIKLVARLQEGKPVIGMFCPRLWLLLLWRELGLLCTRLLFLLRTSSSYPISGRLAFHLAYFWIHSSIERYKLQVFGLLNEQLMYKERTSWLSSAPLVHLDVETKASFVSMKFGELIMAYVESLKKLVEEVYRAVGP